MLRESCSNLQCLKIYRSRSRITDNGVAALTNICRKLLSVDSIISHALTDNSLLYIGLHCDQLESLTIANREVMIMIRVLYLIWELKNWDLKGNNYVN